MKFKHYLYLLPLLSASTLFSQIDPTFPALEGGIQICVGETTMECGEAIVDFGEQAIGTSSSQQITIKNTGDLMQIIFIGNSNLNGSNAFSLNVSGGDPGGLFLPIPPNGQASFDINFTPTTAGSHEAELSFNYLGATRYTTCAIRLLGEGTSNFPFCIEYKDKYTAGNVDLLNSSYEEVSCGSIIQVNLDDYPAIGTYTNLFRITNKGQDELEVCGKIESASGAAQEFTCHFLEPANGQEVFHKAWSPLPPGGTYTFIGTFTATLADGTIQECVLTIIVDRTTQPEPCLDITYSTDHGSNWNPVNCGDEVYINLINNPLGELFPLRYVIQNDCEAELTLSGETDLTWTNTTYLLNPTLLAPGQIVQHSAGSAFLNPGNIYTYVTTLTTEQTPTPETCTITVVVDKQLGIGSGDGDGGRDKNYLSQKPILFPTITTERIHLQLATSAVKAYTIYNLNGKQVKQGKTDDFTTTISIAGLAPGSYFIKIADHPAALRFVVPGK